MVACYLLGSDRVFSGFLPRGTLPYFLAYETRFVLSDFKSVQISDVRILGSPERRRVWFLSVTFHRKHK